MCELKYEWKKVFFEYFMQTLYLPYMIPPLKFVEYSFIIFPFFMISKNENCSKKFYNFLEWLENKGYKN